MATAQYILTLLAILGTGLIAGTFFVFSVAIMSALRRLPPNEGMAAMQSVNRIIQNPIFLGVFMGTAVISLVLAGISVWNWAEPASYYVIAGSALYVIGSFILTIVFNVPLNNALDAADPETASGHEVWSDYLVNWTFWNHVRTVASLLSTAAFAFAFAAK
jgi:uncharacterized membrane protein